MTNRITFHSAHPTYHRWRVTTPDGHIIASSSDSYLDRSEARANVAELFIDGLRSGRFVIEDEADRDAVMRANVDSGEDGFVRLQGDNGSASVICEREGCRDSHGWWWSEELRYGANPADAAKVFSEHLATHAESAGGETNSVVQSR